MAIGESNSVAMLFYKHLSSSGKPQNGIDALEAYWKKNRKSPVAEMDTFSSFSEPS